MQAVNPLSFHTTNETISSAFLKRDVVVDLYLPAKPVDLSQTSLLLINDGQDLGKMSFIRMLDHLSSQDKIQSLVVAGIHASMDRKMEYGLSSGPDYLGRGAHAAAYNRFVMEEFLPFIYQSFGTNNFKEKALAGFSLGGLMAFDSIWNFPNEFTKAGIFSGSLWWRSLAQEDPNYDDEIHRLAHQQVKKGSFYPWLNFFFMTGSLDETMDRNKNGIIDSIDDTIGLIREMEKLGYKIGRDIQYVNYSDGKHDIPTWGRGMEEFLTWGWGR
jgi:enterochelin esterase-like enzyme